MALETAEAARIAYEAYAAHQSWKNYAGHPIPPWEAVRTDIKEAWGAAAEALRFDFAAEGMGLA